MKKTQKATVLIYILFLVALAMTFASIVLDNFSYLSYYSSFSDIENKLYENIKSRAKILVDRNEALNNNWSGFTDAISCPQNIAMSGSTLSGTINSTLTYSGGSIYCLSTYQAADDISIYFNTGYTDFTLADYDWSLASISWGIWSFSDGDSTNIDFSAYIATMTWDLIDDDFNSDNYKWNSTWSTSYPNSYEDDDNLGRKEFFWFVTPDLWFSKIFWSTSQIEDIISNNPNNNDSLNAKLWDVSDARLHIDIDKQYEIKLIKIDKTTYDDTWEIKISDTLTSSWSTWKVWYLQDDLTFSWWVTWSEYQFDFTVNDYAIFLKSAWSDSIYTTWTWTIFYKITWEDAVTWSGIYLVPIDESNPNFTKFVWNELLIDIDWKYIPKHSEIYYDK